MDRIVSQRFLRGMILAVVLLVTLAMIFSLKSILAPLVAGFVIAYILDPLADALERKGLKRFPAVVLIFVVAGILTFGALLGGSVMLARAGNTLAQKTMGEPRIEGVDESQAEEHLGYTDLKKETMSGLPTVWYFDRNGNDRLDIGWFVEAEYLLHENFPGVALGFQRWKDKVIKKYANSADENPDEALAIKVESTLDGSLGRVFDAWLLGSQADPDFKSDMDQGNDENSGPGAFSRLLELGNWLLLVPIYVFFFLLEIDPLLARWRLWIPSGSRPRIEKVASEIHGILSGFFRGRLLVCIIKGVLTGLALTLIGVPYGFLIGFAAGFLSLLPYVGVWLAMIPALGFCWFEYHEITLLLLTAGVFGAMEMLEGFVLVPRFLGEEAGLHPVTVIVTFMIFAQWFGLLGMLLSVPMAAVTKTLLREFVLPLIREQGISPEVA